MQWGALTTAAVFALPAAAQYPAKPVRLVVPFPPGGGVDVTARILAQCLNERTGQTFIIDNRSGASGVEPFAEFINKEIPRWAKVVKAANITPQ